MVGKIKKNGRWRKVRVGRLIPYPAPPSKSALRKNELEKAKAEAERKWPELRAWVGKLAEELRESAKEGDRCSYAPVLAEVYRQVWDWKSLAARTERADGILALRGKKWRKDSTVLGIFVGAVCEDAGTNPKTANRWKNKLDQAWEESVQPDDVECRLRGIQ